MMIHANSKLSAPRVNFQCRRTRKTTYEHWLKHSRKGNNPVAESGIKLIYIWPNY
jgi:hypothetical protein